MKLSTGFRTDVLALVVKFDSKTDSDREWLKEYYIRLKPLLFQSLSSLCFQALLIDWKSYCVLLKRKRFLSSRSCNDFIIWIEFCRLVLQLLVYSFLHVDCLGIVIQLIESLLLLFLQTRYS